MKRIITVELEGEDQAAIVLALAHLCRYFLEQQIDSAEGEAIGKTNPGALNPRPQFRWHATWVTPVE